MIVVLAIYRAVFMATAEQFDGEYAGVQLACFLPRGNIVEIIDDA